MDGKGWKYGVGQCNDEKYRLDPCACVYNNDEFMGGVFCAHGRITQILLQNTQLKGAIPPSLTNLTGLIGLYLDHNHHINGTLPALNFDQFKSGSPGPCGWNGRDDHTCCGLGGLNFTCPLPAGAAEHCGASCH